MMKRLWLVVAVAAGTFALTYASAHAITVTFNDLTGAVTADVTDVPPNPPSGVTVQQQPGDESVSVVINGAFLPDSAPASFTLGLTELPGLQDVSDKITLNKEETGLSVTFTSDTVSTSGAETSLGSCAGISCQPEANPDGSGVANPFLQRDIVIRGVTIPLGLTINAFSDSPERPDRAPEPTTLLLLGSGFISLGVLTYRRRRGR
jgi:PEP-CTERM motif